MSRRNTHTVPRIFDQEGYCVVPLNLVKQIVGVEIIYTDDTIITKRGKETREWPRSKYTDPWQCIRSMRLLQGRFKSKAIKWFQDNKVRIPTVREITES